MSHVPPATRHWPLATAVLAFTAVLAGAATLGTAGPDEGRYADELIGLTNLDRTSNGLPALATDRRLMGLAAERSQDMLARDYFSHAIPPDGRTVFDQMVERGITYRAAGENLEFNTAPQRQTARYAQRDFMNSPTHRALILSSDFDHLGAGVAQGRESRTMYTVLFVGLAAPGAEPPAPMLGGADAPPLPPTPTRAAATPTPRPTQAAAAPTPRPTRTSSEPIPAAGRLRPAGARPLGLIEELVQRTLRLYLGL
ncbi:MAG: hypothetical protein HY690_20505 [Chloroflexi bacterium]|nr:hypothetical protein [Chloroflexota bacterium]